MGAWLGIDVGGTFTDAVVVEDGHVQVSVKRPTTHDDLLAGVLEALDDALAEIEASRVERVALSTTLVTNALLEDRIDPVALLLMPGPGMSLEGRLPGPSVVLEGYVDHRGRLVRAPDPVGVGKACARLGRGGVAAISAKFSVRNPAPERDVARTVHEALAPAHVSLGSEMSGALDFVRRTNSAWYNAAVWRRFATFADAIEQALARRGLRAPLYILKADGGTLPLARARQHPVEAIFTGPAASALGVVALGAPAEDAVSLDIGGTSTDITLWRGGIPLPAERGARVAGFPTSVRSFWLRSVALGGDSEVRRDQDGLHIGPRRQGPAMALGGPVPTVTDALIVAGRVETGQRERALEAMARVRRPEQAPEEAAAEVLEKAVSLVVDGLERTIGDRASEPVYRVEDIVHPERFEPRAVVGVGGGAPGLAPLVASRLGVPCRVPRHAVVANAIGAAVARPTLELTLRGDTELGYYAVGELGIRRPLAPRFGPAEALRQARQHLSEHAARAGIASDEIETVREESFSLVRGFSTVGRIVTCQVQIRPGVLAEVKDGESLS